MSPASEICDWLESKRKLIDKMNAVYDMVEKAKMKTVVIDGVEYEAEFKQCHDGWQYLRYRPLPKPKKTLLETAAELSGATKEYVKGCLPYIHGIVVEAIEQRLQALEKQIEELKK